MTMTEAPVAQDAQLEADVAAWGRRETELERVDRNLSELLQELRVVQTGVQVLFAFLLVVPFSARFDTVTAAQRDLYFAALGLAGAAAVLLIAPAAHHRIVFRCGDKHHLVRTANRYAIAGITMLGASMAASFALVADVLYGSEATIAVLAVTIAGIVLSWYVLPLYRRRRMQADGPDPTI